MKQSERRNKALGQDAFESYYAGVYGDRWPGGNENYLLDPASVCVALCLPVKGVDRVLDLCAAPGGKTLVLCGNLDEGARLFSNERSAERKKRLALSVAGCLSTERAAQVTVTCSDGATWCRKETEAYGSILLDAPCSSERHVLNDSKYLAQWSPSRIKTLSMEQWALLSSAWRLLAPDGWLLYSTCALSPAENDAVIERLVKKFDGVELWGDKTLDVFRANLESFAGTVTLEDGRSLSPYMDAAEKTEFGMRIMPDRAFLGGPLYFCLMHKVSD